MLLQPGQDYFQGDAVQGVVGLGFAHRRFSCDLNASRIQDNPHPRNPGSSRAPNKLARTALFQYACDIIETAIILCHIPAISEKGA